MNKFVVYCNKVIEYSFYLLLFLIPLYFTNNTSELYELNKMWLSWGLTIVIMISWLAKSIAQKRFFLQRTPLDLPILLFLASQLLSTLFSIDQHVSFWGYYSRFNGGFLSLFSYALLFYAFASNYKDISEQNGEENSRFSFPVRLMLFGGGLLLFPIAVILAAPPATNPEGTHPTFLLFSMITAFFLITWSFTSTFLKRLFYVTFTSGFLVALWGIPSHFGKDPTCYLFRGELNVNCWTEAFYPTVRAFSTLGQPAWLAAYAGVLIPLILGFWLIRKNRKERIEELITTTKDFISLHSLSLLGLTSLLYLSLLYTNTRAGFMAFWISFLVFWSILPLQELKKNKKILYLLLFGANVLLAAYLLWREYFFFFWLISIAGFFAVQFIFSRTIFKPLLLSLLLLTGITLISDSSFGRSRMIAPLNFASGPSQSTTAAGSSQQTSQIATSGIGGTDSGKIRLIVWDGAVDIWKANPIFGTGVETFAFAYYQHRPAAHNMTSEWDYLYNKAHNEYLNYLATTGIVGLGTYLFMIGFFLFQVIKWVLQVASKENKQKELILIAAFTAAYISILITNFFGFSVVIINIFLFLIPAFALVVMDKLNTGNAIIYPKQASTDTISSGRWFGIGILIAVGIYLSFLLYIYRKADIAYALGNNLDNVQQYDQALPLLQEAVSLRPGEPIFKDELALNSATIATLILLQQDASQSAEAQTQASQFAQQGISLSNEVVSKSPSNIVFWKNRVRIFYTLSQVDPSYLKNTIEAMKQVSLLAPTDAKVRYNLGELYRSTNALNEAKESHEKAIELKPDYREAYYSLGLTLHSMAVNENGRVTNPSLQQQAEDQMEFILKNFDPKDKEATEKLTEWR